MVGEGRGQGLECFLQKETALECIGANMKPSTVSEKWDKLASEKETDEDKIYRFKRWVARNVAKEIGVNVDVTITLSHLCDAIRKKDECASDKLNAYYNAFEEYRKTGEEKGLEQLKKAKDSALSDLVIHLNSLR